MPKDNETNNSTNKLSQERPGSSWLFGLVGLAALALIFIAGMSFADNHKMHNRLPLGGAGFAHMGDQRHGGERGGLGGTMTKNGETRTSGVVTTVSGSNFTLAGSGSTTQVSTSSSTQYHGGNSVKQNDSVIVIGTKSGDTLNATNVAINP